MGRTESAAWPTCRLREEPGRDGLNWGENSHFHRAGVARQGHVGLLGKRRARVAQPPSFSK